MSGVLVDTNVLIDYLRNLPHAIRYLESESNTMSISAVTVAELHAGAQRDSEREALREFIRSFDVIPADGGICQQGGDFRSSFGPSHGVDLIDGIIAATSLLRDLPLVTLNKKHFPMLQNVIVPYRKH